MDMTIKGNKKYNWLIVWLWWSGMTYKNRTIKETLKQVQKLYYIYYEHDHVIVLCSYETIMDLWYMYKFDKKHW